MSSTQGGGERRPRDDQDTLGFDSVDDGEWIAPQQISTCAVIEVRPRLGIRRDCGLGRVDFLAESLGCVGIALRRASGPQ